MQIIYAEPFRSEEFRSIDRQHGKNDDVAFAREEGVAVRHPAAALDRAAEGEFGQVGVHEIGDGRINSGVELRPPHQARNEAAARADADRNLTAHQQAERIIEEASTEMPFEGSMAVGEHQPHEVPSGHLLVEEARAPEYLRAVFLLVEAPNRAEPSPTSNGLPLAAASFGCVTQRPSGYLLSAEGCRMPAKHN